MMQRKKSISAYLRQDELPVQAYLRRYAFCCFGMRSLVSGTLETSRGTGEVPYYAEETSKTVLRKFPKKSIVRICGSFASAFFYGTQFCPDLTAISSLFLRMANERQMNGIQSRKAWSAILTDFLRNRSCKMFIQKNGSRHSPHAVSDGCLIYCLIPYG